MATDAVSTPESQGKLWIVVGFLAVTFQAGSLLATINVPWVEDDNAFGAAYAQAARNNLRAGLAVTAGVPATFYNGPLPIPADAYYVHHPTLVPLLITGTVAALGEKEWVVKLGSIFCSILSAIFLWYLVAGPLGERAAVFAVALFVTLPMELHYGDLVDYEPYLVMWMLAALICLRHWEQRRTSRWAALAALCCLGALSTDWPGYLFTAAVCGWLILKKRGPGSRRLAVILVALALGSVLLFLFQISHVNPDAWRDLWTAITMRLGTGVQVGSAAGDSSGAVRFGFWEWLGKIFQSLDQNYLRVTWLLLVIGALHLFRRRKSDDARWIASAVLLMAAAGIPYLVILRNWSYVHDFASFFVIGSIAIVSGLGLEAVWRWTDKQSPTSLPRRVVAVATALLLPSLAWAAFVQAQGNRSQFVMLPGAEHEPPHLIPDVGRFLAATFPPETTILCNFDPYFSPLSYYAQRTVFRNLTWPAEWDFAIEGAIKNCGGIVWLDAPRAREIVAALPANQISETEIDGVRFAIWRGPPESGAAR